ncbi:YHYH protein [Inhella proteolytica]|uniref:YHYH protein n=1 Tax=Inhella proteolytica TaxID=2795029 RepID=A0A931NGP7_9BURK|nr:YHYH protein [Inhella proteolytica]MBH9575675.1 YHYH protein [Inhella proteolytica]
MPPSPTMVCTRLPRPHRPAASVALALALSACGGGAEGPTLEGVRISAAASESAAVGGLASLSPGTKALALAASAGGLARYEGPSGMLTLPSLTVSNGAESGCFDVSLRTLNLAPVQVEVVSATPMGCAAQGAGRYEGASGLLSLPGLVVSGNGADSCHDVTLRTLGTSPSIRLELQSALPVACSAAPPASSVPSAPRNLTATPGNASAQLSFSAPASDGGSPLTGYTATCSTGTASASASGSASPLSVSGLSNGSAYQCSVVARNAVGSSPASAAVSVTPVAPPPTSSFSLTSSLGAEGSAMPADYSCDGPGSSPPLAWANPPAGTKEFALLMSTLPGDGSTKYNWVLYNLSASRSALARDAFGAGTLGVGSDGPMAAYQPPCSQGPGAKTYTFTLYALSGAPVLSTSPVTGEALQAAIAPLTLGKAVLNLSYARTASASGSSAPCMLVRNSVAVSTTGRPTVGCDSSYAYIGSDGLTTHTMMDGITATNLQVPIAQNFYGSKAWRIPLNPALAASTTSAVDGPIGMAINGVPIFNPCKQGGCQNGDTKVLGELDVCNGHAGRADDYHYHAAPVCLMATKPASYWDTHPLGWALDGFAIYGTNNADGSPAPRDGICGGNTSPVINGPAGYSYHVTEASPYVLSCFRGTPSPDLAGQSAKFSPMRQPPVTPFAISAMTLRTDAADGYQVLQFTSARSFTTTETGSDSYANAPGTYRIRYQRVTGAALDALLAQTANRSKSACWNFQFTSGTGASTQPPITYCR